MERIPTTLRSFNREHCGGSHWASKFLNVLPPFPEIFSFSPDLFIPYCWIAMSPPNQFDLLPTRMLFITLLSGLHIVDSPPMSRYCSPPGSSGRVNGQASHIAVRILASKRPLSDITPFSKNRGAPIMWMATANGGGGRSEPKPGQRQPRSPPPATPRPYDFTRLPSPTLMPSQLACRSDRFRSRRPPPSPLFHFAPLEDLEPENVFDDNTNPNIGFRNISEYEASDEEPPAIAASGPTSMTS